MKIVILAGGYGTRLSEETNIKPKPLVRIGSKPIIWHIMKIYSHYGYKDFIICLGYKGYMIKDYFANYFLHMSDVTFDLKSNEMHVHGQRSEPWKVTLVDTGEDSMTGGRLKRASEYLSSEKAFCLTYGDGLAGSIWGGVDGSWIVYTPCDTLSTGSGNFGGGLGVGSNYPGEAPAGTSFGTIPNGVAVTDYTGAESQFVDFGFAECENSEMQGSAGETCRYCSCLVPHGGIDGGGASTLYGYDLGGNNTYGGFNFESYNGY